MINNCVGEDICDMWQAHYKDLLNSVDSFKSKEFVERKLTKLQILQLYSLRWIFLRHLKTLRPEKHVE